MLTVILINVLTIALLWSWLLSLHVQNDPIHHLSDPYPDLWHVLRITFVSCVQIHFKISKDANQSVSKKEIYVLFICVCTNQVHRQPDICHKKNSWKSFRDQ